ncbi:MAG: DUF1697 domain-containing protein [Saprospiraceae bacterium]|nr:DUF1697 domain-containing protein [Candidatus Brachybacter algidus]
MRIRPNGSDGGHNGLKHINETFGNHVYARMRVGIGDNFSRGRQVDYVLGKWDKKEQETLPDIIVHAAGGVFHWNPSVITAMNKFTKNKMQTFAAFLEGVSMSQDRSRSRWSKLKARWRFGFEEVHTYIQSGNIFFKSEGKRGGKLQTTSKRHS